MALIINKNFNGVNLTYHKIIDLIEDYRKNNSIIIVASYLDKNSRDLDQNNIFETRQYEFENLDLTRSLTYDILKLNSDFIGSIDN